MIDVVIYNEKGRVTRVFGDLPEGSEDDSTIEQESSVNYVSFVNGGTFGPPQLVSPVTKAGKATVPPTAKIGDCVLYINTTMTPAFTLTRVSDEGEEAE